MNDIPIAGLGLVDLKGQPVELQELVKSYILLIFLRHLA
jgi:hypothetical protein